MVAEVRERLSANKGESQKFDVEKSDIKTLNEVEVKERNQLQMSKKCADLENRKAVRISTGMEKVSDIQTNRQLNTV